MEKRSIKINFIMNTLLTMSAFIFPLITFPYVSRVLGAEGVGRVSFATSIVAYFNMFAQLGVPVYGIRACARVRDDKEKLTKTAQELLLINLIMTVAASAFLALAVLIIPKLHEEKLLYMLIGTTLILNAIGMEWLFKALEQYTYITVRSLVFKFISVCAMFALVRSESDYIWYALVTVIASSASYVFNLFYAGKYIRLRPVGGYDLKRHMKPVMIFFAMSCATTVYTNLDAVMLGFMRSDTDVGYYHAAVRIKSILVSIVTSLGAVLLPRASYFIERRQMHEFRRIASKALNFVFVCAVPLMVYFMIFAREGVLLLSGDDFIPAVPAMQIIMPTLVFIGITNILGIQMLVPLGREKQVLYSEIGGALADLVLNALLIPVYGAAGAAVGTLVAEAVVLALQVYYLFSRGSNILYRAEDEDTSSRMSNWSVGTFPMFRKIFIATVLGSLSCLWVKSLSLHAFFLLLISAALFFGVYVILLLLMKEELMTGIWQDLIKRIIP